MNILGLDPATVTGFCIAADGQIVASGIWSLPSRSDDHAGKRLVRLRELILELNLAHPLGKIAYEQSVMGTTGKKGRGIQFTTLAFHAELRGVLKQVACELGVPCVPFGIGTIKKFATGSGRAEKYQIIAACQRQFGIVVRDDNEADAIMVAKLAEQEHTARQRLVKRARTEPRIKQEKLF